MIQWTTNDLSRTGNETFEIMEENIVKFRQAMQEMIKDSFEDKDLKHVSLTMAEFTPNEVGVTFNGEVVGTYVVPIKEFLCPIEGYYSVLFNPKPVFHEGRELQDQEHLVVN